MARTIVMSEGGVSSRLRWINLGDYDGLDEGLDVIEGLSNSPKTLPCRYFYDERGSLLFERICQLPEYYVTRTEQAVLASCAEEIARLTGACELVELGSGSSGKSRWLLDAYNQLDSPLFYCPIDVSAGMLKSSALDLLREYPKLQVCGVAGTYEAALSQLSASEFVPRMLIFLGSKLGNLSPHAGDRFLSHIKYNLQPGEFFLLGVDLQKSPEIIEAAYNDTQGVTAAFNLNILRHINRRFDGNFPVDQFTHFAFYNQVAEQIEMYLRCWQSGIVRLDSLNLSVPIQAGETIRTEIYRKFYLPSLISNLKQQGFQSVRVWTDPQNWFALLLCQC